MHEGLPQCIPPTGHHISKSVPEHTYTIAYTCSIQLYMVIWTDILYFIYGIYSTAIKIYNIVMIGRERKAGFTLHRVVSRNVANL